MCRAFGLLLCCAALALAPAADARSKGNRLLRISTPSSTVQVPAHPFVNVIVRFGTDEGTPDPSTFRAKLAGVNITPLFDQVVENGTIVGMRASIGPALLIVGSGKHRANTLRLEVRGKIGKHRVRDVDRLRFAAIDVPDEPPVARALSSSEIILPGIPQQFDATQSHDPESDLLTYRWDFGDGTTSAETRPVHIFGAATTETTVVTLTVSDEQLDGSDQLSMVSVPPLQPGRTPGIIAIGATASLEFGAVPLGSNGTRSFTIGNNDNAPTSELHVRLGTTTPAFTLSDDDIDLGPGESANVDLLFTPTADGHQSSVVTLVASAQNRTVLHMLSHGFGGAAPGWGPLPVADPLFYTTALGTNAILPGGAAITLDDSVHGCVGGSGTQDYCLTDADCAPNGGTCPASGSCLGGDRAGQGCASQAECPRGRCSASQPFLPIDLCGDGAGGVVMLSDEGTFTDNSGGDVDFSETLMHLSLDANGNRTGATILARISESTTQLACDAIPPSQGGQAYIAEYRAVTGPDSCFRDAREALVARRKTNGSDNTLMSRIDAAENLPDCEDYDPVTDLHVTPDGDAWFASLPNTGLWRIRSSPLLIVPNFDDFFALHPDGSVVVVRATDVGPTGVLRVYKISPDLVAASGAPNLTDLNPCGSAEVPNNGGHTLIDTTYAVDRKAPGSFDGTILVSFITSGAPRALAAPVAVRGTFAFDSPAGSDRCPTIGIVNLDFLDDLSF
jgi:PKD repeat protein